MTEFGRLYLTCWDKFTVIARSYVRSQEIAEDIVSECFAAYWERRETLEVTISPQAYILKAVKNRCLNYLRDNARLISSGFASTDPDADSALRSILPEIAALESPDTADIFSSEVETIFRKFLSDLQSLPRDIFMSSRFGDMTYAEIAEKYGVSTRKVKREIQKALARLREMLEDYLPAAVITLLLNVLS